MESSSNCRINNDSSVQQQKYIVFVADKGTGGLGDRLVGLCSCLILSKVLGRKLLVQWRFPDISTSLKLVSKYDYLSFSSMSIGKGKDVKNEELQSTIVPETTEESASSSDVKSSTSTFRKLRTRFTRLTYGIDMETKKLIVDQRRPQSFSLDTFDHRMRFTVEESTNHLHVQYLEPLEDMDTYFRKQNLFVDWELRNTVYLKINQNLVPKLLSNEWCKHVFWDYGEKKSTEDSTTNHFTNKTSPIEKRMKDDIGLSIRMTSISEYDTVIKRAYRYIFREILIPTEPVHEMMLPFCGELMNAYSNHESIPLKTFDSLSDSKPLYSEKEIICNSSNNNSTDDNRITVGIHVRLGDNYIHMPLPDAQMYASERLSKLFDSFYNKVLETIKERKDNKFNSEMSKRSSLHSSPSIDQNAEQPFTVTVFIASDTELTYLLGSLKGKALGFKVHFLPEPVTHIDQESCYRSALNDNDTDNAPNTTSQVHSISNESAMHKMIADLLLLSMCEMTFSCEYSNFGRIASILSNGYHKWGWHYHQEYQSPNSLQKRKETDLVALSVLTLSDKSIHYRGEGKWTCEPTQLFV